MNRTLIVIDVQQEFDDPAWGERNNPGAEGKVAQALSAWRERGAPIIHVRHESPPDEGVFLAGTPGVDFKPATFARAAPYGDVIPAETMHRTALARLNNEFADVIDTDAAIERLDSGA